MTHFTSSTTDKLQATIPVDSAFLLDDRLEAFTPKHCYTVYLDGVLQGKFTRSESVERLLKVNIGKRFEVYRETFY